MGTFQNERERERAQMCKMRWAFLPFLELDRTTPPLLNVIKKKKIFFLNSILCSKSHHFRFSNCISHGSAQERHPVPLVVRQVLAVGSLCAQRWATYHRPPRRGPPPSSLSILCFLLYTVSSASLSISKDTTHDPPRTLSVCLSRDPSFPFSWMANSTLAGT